MTIGHHLYISSLIVIIIGHHLHMTIGHLIEVRLLTTIGHHLHMTIGHLIEVRLHINIEVR